MDRVTNNDYRISEITKKISSYEKDYRELVQLYKRVYRNIDVDQELGKRIDGLKKIVDEIKKELNSL